MAKFSSSGKKKINGMVKLNILVKMLQKSLLLKRRWHSYYNSYEEVINCVPDDVKEGNFVVIAVDCEEPRRFVVPLCYLSHPTFVNLLELSAQEYGFDHKGALKIPCHPIALEKILAENWEEEAS